MTLNPTFFIIAVLSPELFPGSSFKTGPDWYRLSALMEPEIQIVGFTLLDHPPCSPGAAHGCRRSLVASSVLRNLPKTLCAHPGLRRVTLSWDLAGTLGDIPWLLGPPCPRRLLRGGWRLAVVPRSGRMRWQWGGCKPEIWGSRGLRLRRDLLAGLELAGRSCVPPLGPRQGTGGWKRFSCSS